MTGKQMPWQTDENKTSVRNARRGKKSNVGGKKRVPAGENRAEKTPTTLQIAEPGH